MSLCAGYKVASYCKVCEKMMYLSVDAYNNISTAHLLQTLQKHRDKLLFLYCVSIHVIL